MIFDRKSLFLCALAAGATVARADDFGDVVIKATPLTASISMLEGAGGNMTALIGADGVFLVDDDFAEMADKLVAKLKDLKGDRPRFIVNTHFHYDHSGANEVFGATATIIAATQVRTRLEHDQMLWGTSHPPVPPQALPILTFGRSLAMHLNQEEIRIVHLPHGHTDGDTVVFFDKAKIVATGDLYFSGMYPIFHPEHRGSLRGVVRNLEWILARSPVDARFVPGHGPLSGRREVRTYLDMILASLATVQEGIRRGQSLEQIQKAGLDPKWDSFSHGYLTTARWLGLVYAEVTSTRKAD